MPMPSALVTRFFQLIVNRQFAEAERELERLRQKMHKTEWNRGYYRALHGMLLARRSNSDQYIFFSKIDLNDKQILQNYRREFLNHVRNGLHGDYDRGFFSAWADCMRILSKISANDPKKDKQTRGKRKIKEQITIEDFLKRKNKLN